MSCLDTLLSTDPRGRSPPACRICRSNEAELGDSRTPKGVPATKRPSAQPRVRPIVRGKQSRTAVEDTPCARTKESKTGAGIANYGGASLSRVPGWTPPVGATDFHYVCGA